jgi:hypothetical protein
MRHGADKDRAASADVAAAVPEIQTVEMGMEQDINDPAGRRWQSFGVWHRPHVIRISISQVWLESPEDRQMAQFQLQIATEEVAGIASLRNSVATREGDDEHCKARLAASRHGTLRHGTT